LVFLIAIGSFFAVDLTVCSAPEGRGSPGGISFKLLLWLAVSVSPDVWLLP
jgi:hypothetical protein